MNIVFKILALLSIFVLSVTLYAEENASNPLAKVKNTDLRLQHFDLGNGDLNQASVEGAFMANDQLKIKYELYYQHAKAFGLSEHDFDSSVIKLIYFARDKKVEGTSYRLALGLDWVKDLSNDDNQVIGLGSDLVGPFAGLSISYNSGITLIPLVQHYVGYSGDDYNVTAFRLIGMKPLPGKSWLKLDAKAPIDWENDKNVPANVEFQYGQTMSNGIGLFGDLLIGVGSDKPYNWGLGIGLRFNY